MENIFSLKNIILYVIIINLITFIVMYIDKRKAKKTKRRIAERTLFTLAFIGGSIGAIVGMYTFRHKTKKSRFIIGMPMILIMQVLIVIGILVTR